MRPDLNRQLSNPRIRSDPRSDIGNQPPSSSDQRSLVIQSDRGKYLGAAIGSREPRVVRGILGGETVFAANHRAPSFGAMIVTA